MQYINGMDREQLELLPESLEDYVGAENPVRVIDAYINSVELRGMGFGHSVLAETGRPPYDPRDILKLYVYGYMNRIRSSRRLEKETKRNLEIIWLLKKLSPDHKTIARFRQENAEALKNVFRDFVQLCGKMDLYGKELVAIDGSKFKAVNSKERNFTGKKLKDRIERIEAKIEGYLAELETADAAEESAIVEKSAQEITEIVRDLRERKAKYQAYEKELEETGETQKSLTDPESRLMLSNGKMDVCYNVQTAVDAKNKMIVEFEVTNNAADSNQIRPMSAKTTEILEAEKISVTADAGYSSAQDIFASMEAGVSVHVAGTDFDICIPADRRKNAPITEHKNGRCVYIAERNIVLCPMGNILYPGYYKATDKYGIFYSSKACKECACNCVKEGRGRRHPVPMAEENFSKKCNDKNLFVRQIRIKADKAIVSQRKSIVEHPFGSIKRNMDAGYCLTKGIRNVGGEFSLTFLAYNLKRAITTLGSAKLIAACQV
jgi:transposase